jgi:glycosyltransferase involved in cell wall biosynthesis
MAGLLFVTNQLDPANAEVLRGLAQAGFPVRVLARENDPLFRDVAAMGLEVLPMGPHSAVRSIREAVQAHQPDLVHVLRDEFTVFCAVKALRGLPPVLVASTGLTGGLGRWSKLIRHGLRNRRVRHVVCHSHATRRFLRKVGLKYDRMTTLYPPCDPADYAKVQAADLSPWGVGERDAAVVCVTDVNPTSGVLPLLESARFLGAQPRIHFFILGRVLDERVNDLRRHHGSPHAIHLLEPVDDPLPFIAAADVFAMIPSRVAEMPAVHIQAMALGRPVIVSPTGGMRELIEHRFNGYLCTGEDPRDIAKSINRYLRDPQLARMSGDNARRTIQTQLHPREIVRASLRMYAELGIRPTGPTG